MLFYKSIIAGTWKIMITNIINIIVDIPSLGYSTDERLK